MLDDDSGPLSLVAIQESTASQTVPCCQEQHFRTGQGGHFWRSESRESVASHLSHSRCMPPTSLACNSSTYSTVQSRGPASLIAGGEQQHEHNSTKGIWVLLLVLLLWPLTDTGCQMMRYLLESYQQQTTGTFNVIVHQHFCDIWMQL